MTSLLIAFFIVMFFYFVRNEIKTFVRQMKAVVKWLVPKPTLTEEQELWDKIVAAGGCVECKTYPKAFHEGPSGGICTNIFCAHCGQGYNVAPTVHWAERIHKDVRYMSRRN
jgi:hypothetical protein